MARQPTTSIDTKKIPEAIAMLDNGATKKAVCAFLGIAYNTTRLQTEIDDYLSGVERSKEQRRKRRGKPISKDELVNMIEAYLINNDSIAAIGERYYRSTALVTATLNSVGALLKSNKAADPLHPTEVPEQAIAETFEIGERVWNTQYGCIAEIKKELPNGVYRMYLLDSAQHRYVHAYNYDIASLKHLEVLGVDTSRLGNIMSRDEIITLINEALIKAKKNADHKI